VGTGFSFTENDSGYARKLEDVTTDLFQVLKQFFELFPNFRSRDFYVTGQSYAGTKFNIITQNIQATVKYETGQVMMRVVAVLFFFRKIRTRAFSQDTPGK